MWGEKRTKTLKDFSPAPKPPFLSPLCHSLKQLTGPKVMTELWDKRETERENLMKDHGGEEIVRQR